MTTKVGGQSPSIVSGAAASYVAATVLGERALKWLAGLTDQGFTADPEIWYWVCRHDSIASHTLEEGQGAKEIVLVGF
jgi:hypothetical protein